MSTCGRGIVALPGGGDLQREGLARPRGNTGCDGVPPQTTMHLIIMAAYVGFGSKGFEAHWAGFPGRCAKSPWPTFITTRRIAILNVYFEKTNMKTKILQKEQTFFYR